MIEEFEDDLSEWYYKHQEENLYHWLCWKRVLKGKQKNKGIRIVLYYGQITRNLSELNVCFIECLPDLSEVKENEIKDEKTKKEEGTFYENGGRKTDEEGINSRLKLKDKLSERVEL